MDKTRKIMLGYCKWLIEESKFIVWELISVLGIFLLLSIIIPLKLLAPLFIIILSVYLFIKSTKREIEASLYDQIKQAIQKEQLSLEEYKSCLVDNKLTLINFWYLLGVVEEKKRSYQINQENKKLEAIKTEIISGAKNEN